MIKFFRHNDSIQYIKSRYKMREKENINVHDDTKETELCYRVDFLQYYKNN